MFRYFRRVRYGKSSSSYKLRTVARRVQLPPHFRHRSWFMFWASFKLGFVDDIAGRCWGLVGLCFLHNAAAGLLISWTAFLKVRTPEALIAKTETRAAPLRDSFAHGVLCVRNTLTGVAMKKSLVAVRCRGGCRGDWLDHLCVEGDPPSSAANDMLPAKAAIHRNPKI